jgi:hypothetical protein
MTKHRRQKLNHNKRRLPPQPRPPQSAVLRDDPDAVPTFAEWCLLNSIGQRTGRRIIASGDGPTITHLSGHRFGVSRRNSLAWQQARERLA